LAEKYNIFYFEEPNIPTPKMTKYISENINIPLASEKEFIPDAVCAVF